MSDLPASRDLKILDTVFLRGPNRWSYRPALEALVDIGALEESPSNTIPGFVERLREWLPGLVEHECSYGERGGFLRRLEEGTWPGHILEHVTLELQTLAGYDAGYGRARSTSKTGVYWVVVRITHEELTLACLLAARELVLAAMDDRPFDVRTTVRGLRKLAEEIGYGPSTAAIVEAATKAEIPTVRLAQGGNLVLLGHGLNQRRIWTAETDRTSAIAEGIARDKDLAKKVVGRLGIPVPEGTLARTEDEAVSAARDLEGVVVVKPRSASRGEAVTLALDAEDTEAIRSAFRAAKTHSSAVVLERYVPGHEHRLLVVGERVIALTKAAPIEIVGDGRRTFRELLELAVAGLGSAERGSAVDALDLLGTPTLRLELRREGIDEGTVLEAGRAVRVHRSGKYGVDALSVAHPELLYQAALAVRAVGLDIGGVDVVTTDVRRPLRETGGAIIEINAGPSLLPHLRSHASGEKSVGEAIVHELFPPGAESRIPLVGVAGSGDTTTVARLVGYLLRLAEKTVGVASRTGVYLGARRIDRRDAANFEGGQRILLNRTLNAAVLETSPESLLREGLPYDLCLVGVVTSVAPEPALAKFDVRDEDQVAHVLRTQIDVVRANGAAVLNADDDRVRGMAQYSRGEVILYSTDPTSARIAEHLGLGGRAVTPGPLGLAFHRGTSAESVRIEGALRLETTLAAATAAWAVGIPPELIGSGILTFPSAMLAMDEAHDVDRRASSPNL